MVVVAVVGGVEDAVAGRGKLASAAGCGCTAGAARTGGGTFLSMRMKIPTATSLSGAIAMGAEEGKERGGERRRWMVGERVRRIGGEEGCESVQMEVG